MSNVRLNLCDRNHLNGALPPAVRSRITNGSVVLYGVNGRSREVRRYRDVLDGLLSQLGREPSASDLIFAREAAGLAVWLEQHASARLRGESTRDTTTATNALRRLLADLGLSSRGRHRPRIKAAVRPSLSHGGAIA
jgi:hypothetical protein